MRAYADKRHGRFELRRASATCALGRIASLERWPEVEAAMLVESLRDSRFNRP